jgi:RNA polymerase sigma-70 factor, ECF subfamily
MTNQGWLAEQFEQSRPHLEAVSYGMLGTAPRFVNLARPVLVNGEAGALFGSHDDPIAVIGFTVVGGRVAELNLVADPAKLRHLTIEP